jgi:hypothetical protein
MGYARALVSSTRYETQGISGGVGTTVTASATVNTKGSYATLGTTGFEYDGFFLALTGFGGGGAARYRVDVSANTGGSDQLIVEDLYFDPSASGTYYNAQDTVLIPVCVPAGATLKARTQSTSASVTMGISVLGYQGDAKATKGFRALKSATDWTNTDPTNSITLSGTTQTGWTQIMASTPVRFAGLHLALDSLGNTGLTTAHATFEVGIGALGSEHTTGIIVAAQLAATVICRARGPFPCNIAAGTRLSVRAQCDAANTNALGVVLNGLAA